LARLGSIYEGAHSSEEVEIEGSELLDVGLGDRENIETKDARVTTLQAFDGARCHDVASAQLRVELELPELDDTLSSSVQVVGGETGDEIHIFSDEVMPYIGSNRVDIDTTRKTDRVSSYNPDFPETSHGYFGTDRCATLQSLPIEASTGLGIRELLSDNLLSGVAMTLECTIGEVEDRVTAPSRELSVTLQLPELFCPPLGLPNEVAAVASAAVDDRQLGVMNAWVRPTEAFCIDTSEGEKCKMVTVSLSGTRAEAAKRGAASASGVSNGFTSVTASGWDALQLQLQLRDGQRTLFATYSEPVMEDGNRVICHGSLEL
jgi:hypothetical protein